MTPEVKKSLYEFASEIAEELYEQYGAEGLWVTKDQLPSDEGEFTEQEYKKVLSPERKAAFENGDPLTECELEELREHRLEAMLQGDVDGDAIPSYCLAEVTDADDNTGIALILCNGYSFSGLKIWVQEIFDTEEAARAYLEANGWVSWL
jgi:hypothetical protein